MKLSEFPTFLENIDGSFLFKKKDIFHFLSVCRLSHMYLFKLSFTYSCFPELEALFQDRCTYLGLARRGMKYPDPLLSEV